MKMQILSHVVWDLRMPLGAGELHLQTQSFACRREHTYMYMYIHDNYVYTCTCKSEYRCPTVQNSTDDQSQYKAVHSKPPCTCIIMLKETQVCIHFWYTAWNLENQAHHPVGHLSKHVAPSWNMQPVNCYLNLGPMCPATCTLKSDFASVQYSLPKLFHFVHNAYHGACFYSRLLHCVMNFFSWKFIASVISSLKAGPILTV